MVAGPASDLSLDEVDEPTVAGLDEGSDDALALDDDGSIDINTDSILLSEAELGDSLGRPPSTIIGKAELDLDADLDLSPLDKGAGPASDVRLASESDLLPVGDDDLGLDLPSPSGNSKASKNSKSIWKPNRAASSRPTMWPRRKRRPRPPVQQETVRAEQVGRNERSRPRAAR